MTAEEKINAIRAASQNGKLACADAHVLAEKLEIPLEEIGRICNEQKIKIKNCQLGCF